jgi:hypothetical protein
VIWGWSDDYSIRQRFVLISCVGKEKMGDIGTISVGVNKGTESCRIYKEEGGKSGNKRVKRDFDVDPAKWNHNGSKWSAAQFAEHKG